jgi:hypothetical protein
MKKKQKNSNEWSDWLIKKTIETLLELIVGILLILANKYIG